MKLIKVIRQGLIALFITSLLVGGVGCSSSTSGSGTGASGSAQ